MADADFNAWTDLITKVLLLIFLAGFLGGLLWRFIKEAWRD